MEQEELVDCDPGEYIILSDQISLLETLIQNHAILRAEIPQCLLIKTELDNNYENFNSLSGNLKSKLESLIILAGRLPVNERKRIIIFTEKIKYSWKQMAKKLTDEHAGFFVASKTNYGLPLTSLMNTIKNETSAVQISLVIGEELYDKEYIIKGKIYCNEINHLLNKMNGCDEKVQQYLIMPKLSTHIQELDSMIEIFASRTNLLSLKHKQCNDFNSVFTSLSGLLTGEIYGWLPVDPRIIKTQNSKNNKSVVVTKNNRRTQIKSLRHLPLFH